MCAGKLHPASLREPPPHGADTRDLGVVERVSLAQSGDHDEHTLAPSERLFGLGAQPRPGVGADLPARDPAPKSANGVVVRIERTRSSARETALRSPDALERDNEVPPGIGSDERGRVVVLTEPDRDAVREVSFKRPARVRSRQIAHSGLFTGIPRAL
jgi:hypothetical protein